MSTKKSPGKLILFGDHSGVYPNCKMLITTVGLYATCTAERTNNPKFFFNHKDYPELSTQISTEEAIETYYAIRMKYRELVAKDKARYIGKAIRDRIHVIEIGLGIIADFINSKKTGIGGFNIEFSSELPIGAGFGSSAATSNAIIKACLAEAAIKYTVEELFELTLEFEKFIHGTPSGGDPAAISYGKLIKLEKDEENKPNIIPVEEISESTKSALQNVFVVYSGLPEASTLELVGNVREKWQEDKNKYENLFAEVNLIIDSKLKANEENLIVGDSVKQSFEKAHKILCELDVVSDKTKEFIAEVEAIGGAGKISGAGGAKTGGSGSVLVYLERSKENVIRLENLCAKYQFGILDIEMAVESEL